MPTYLILSLIIGAGLVLFFNGRNSGSMFQKVTGLVFVVASVGLFSLLFLAEAKKMSVI